ncbi:hypothetical protein [Saccharopolyspora gloriosae]|nr:hypothetical protein [Saccharopolyspora gloriosae]
MGRANLRRLKDVVMSRLGIGNPGRRDPLLHTGPRTPPDAPR